MSPRSRIPSGRIFFDPPNRRHAIAFLMSAHTRVSFPLLLPPPESPQGLTLVPKDTRCDAAAEALVEPLAPGHLAKLLLLLGGKVARPPPGAVRIDLEAEDAEVGLTEGDGSSAAAALLAGLERRVDSGRDDACAGDDFAGEVAASSG